MLNPTEILPAGKDLFESAKLNPELKGELDKRELKHPDIWDGPMPPVPGRRILERAAGDHLPAEGNGHWEGERGEGTWYPPEEKIPGKNNPDNLTWEELLDKYGLDGIQFENGEPDLKDVSREEVTIEDFSTNRSDNFDKADKATAENRGCTPEEVAQWRKEHGYTWHEMKDMKTMQKVPSDLHNNIPHSGGIANAKAQEGEK